MTGFPLELYPPTFAFFLLVLLLTFVPKEKYKELFWFGLIWGYLGSTVLVFFFSTVFKLFHYERVMPTITFGGPLWLTFAWIPTIMLYLHYLPTRKEWYVFPLYLVAFSVAGTEVERIFNRCGYLVYSHWSPVYRFFLSLVWFYLVALHYRHWYPVEEKG